jgi:hypothetical protein
LFSLVLIRLLLAPLLVAIATSAGYRFGPKITGWVAGFPVVAGPILLLFALEQGPHFAAQAAESSLLGAVSLSAFCLMYTHVARHYPWPVSLVSGWICFGGLTYLLQSFPSVWWLNAGIALGAVHLALLMLPKSHSPLLPRTKRQWDIPSRMLATATLVIGLTSAARGIGSHISGLLTPFPVVTSVIAVFAHRNQGFPGAVRTLQGLLTSMSAFVAFCAVLSLTLLHLGIAGAFAAAVLINVLILCMTLLRLRRDVA